MSSPDDRKANLKSVKELIAESPNVDNTAVFEQLRAIQDALWAKITGRFDLTMDPSTLPHQPYYSLDRNAMGNLCGYTGPEVDWAVCSWVGNPKLSFCNMHITLWMGPQTRLPHLAFAFGTFPVVFFLMDYIPRVDVRVEPEYLDRYLAPANERYLALQNDKRLMPFISQSTFVRAAVSAVGYNFISPPGTPGVLELIDETAHEFLDRWLSWVDAAEAAPESERAALAARDLAIRRNNAERDPANVVVERAYGKDLTDALVRGLWGGDRVLEMEVI
jgi:hypothetical protein